MRIASANCGSVWSQTFSYDAFGNITKTGSSQFQPTYSYATNQMSSIGSFTPTYDSNGDVLNDALHSYAWDAETRPTTIDTVTATYDALERMVEQNKGGVYTQILYSPTGFKMELMNGQSSFVKAFVPMPGGTEEVWQASGSSPYYRHSDWLGSSRFASTSTRTMYNDLAYAPFGEQYAQAGSTGVTDTSFAGNNEDTTTNLYDAYFREYGIQGRWPSPDPAGVAAVDLSNPQSWNRYAYALNNPLALTDPSGMSPGLASDCQAEYQNCSSADGGEAEIVAGGNGGGSDCMLNGVYTPCSIVQAAMGAGAAVDLGSVELYLTGGIPVPGSAYNPNDPSNPSLFFGADGTIYVNNISSDSIAGTYSSYFESWPNYTPLSSFGPTGPTPGEIAAQQAARNMRGVGQKITNPPMREGPPEGNPTQEILDMMYNTPVAKAFRLLGGALGNFGRGIGDYFLMFRIPCDATGNPPGCIRPMS